MDIISKPYSHLDGVITIQLQEEDYLPTLAKKIQAERTKLSLKGFRKGQAPTSFLKKIYGHKLLFDVSLQLALDQLHNYFKNQELLSMPIMLDNTFDHANDIDINYPGVLEFNFIYGLKPTIDLSTLNQIHVHGYEIREVPENYVLDYIHKLRIRYGTKEEVEKVERDDMLYVSFYDSEGKECNVYLPAEGMQIGEHHFNFVGLQVGDTFTIGFPLGDELQLPTNNSYYQKTIADFRNCTGEYNLALKQIYHLTLAEIDDVLLQHPFPKENGATIETLKEYTTKRFIAEIQAEADIMLEDDIKNLVLEHLTFDLPHTFIKKKHEIDSIKNEEQDKDSEEGALENKFIRWTLLGNEVCTTYGGSPDARAVALYIRMIQPSYERNKSIEKLTEQIEKNLDSNTPNKLYTSIYMFLKDMETKKILRNLVTVHTESKTVAEFENYVREGNKKQ